MDESNRGNAHVYSAECSPIRLQQIERYDAHSCVHLEPGTFFYQLFNGTTFPPSGRITINRDGGTLPAWFRGDDTSAFPPFEGSGFAANNFQRANGSYLDDYLISPPISNVGQPGWVDSLVFFARSQLNPPPAANFPDFPMVLLSTGGADTSSITILLDYFALPSAIFFTTFNQQAAVEISSASTQCVSFVRRLPRCGLPLYRQLLLLNRTIRTRSIL